MLRAASSLFSTTGLWRSNVSVRTQPAPIRQSLSTPFQAFAHYEAPLESAATSLLQYIPKNRSIPTFLSSIKDNNEKVAELLAAIQKGDSTADIFCDPNCDLYLMHLQQSKAILAAEAMTVHAYLLALMQFTGLQPVRTEDADIKLRRKVSVCPLVSDGVLTVWGMYYVERVKWRFNDKIVHPIDKDALRKYILALSPTEQWLLQIHHPQKAAVKYHDTNAVLVSADVLKSALYYNIPFLAAFPILPEDALASDERGFMLVPSTSLIHYFLRDISPAPLQMSPIFGRIGLPSLRLLHEQHKHPVAFYSRHVKSNLPSVHGSRGGPFFQWLHDVGHTLWGSMLTPDERRQLFDKVLPFFDKACDEAAQHKDSEALDIIQEIKASLCDFDLTPLEHYKHPDRRFIDYIKLRSRLNKYGTFYVDSDSMGENVEERIFILLHKTFNQLGSVREDDYLYREVIPHLMLSWWNSKAMALIALSGNHLNTRYTFKRDTAVTIDWQRWLDLFESTQDSLAIWEVARNQYNEELMALIIDHGLVFYHPYLSLTEKIRQEMIALAKSQLSALAYDKSISSMRQHHRLFGCQPGITKTADAAPIAAVDASIRKHQPN
jgi:hypothetical protein